MFKLIKTYLDYFIELILPDLCLNCNARLDKKFLCSKCENSLEFLSKDICEFCGKPLEKDKYCQCRNGNFLFDKARSVFVFNDILRNIIHSMKYEESTSIGTYLGNLAAVYLKKFSPFEKIDIVSPVPLHRVKKRIRGYNQSEYISRKIAKEMNWKHLPTLIKRIRFTDTQTRLSAKAREKNVSNAFGLNSGHNINGKNILLIDDVFTTGSTANSITRYLKENGVNKVYVLTVARA